MKRFFALLSALSIAACAPYPPPPAAPYRGVGTEPFWTLIVDERNVTFIRPEEQPIVQPKPKAIVGVAGEIYQTPRIDVNVVHARCSDGMSDRAYPTSCRSPSTAPATTAAAASKSP